MSSKIYREGQLVDGKYLLKRQLGAGAFGTVWLAQSVDSQDSFALKFLQKEYRKDNKTKLRFIQEAEIQARLRHNNIVEVVDWQGEGDDVYLVMRFVDGDSLHDLLESRSKEQDKHLPLRLVRWMVEQLASAVHFAHEHQIVHRDLKPKNILVNKRRQRPYLKILDFGIAKVLEGPEANLTTAGRVLGSVLYVSPEQVLSQAKEPSVDQFALASIFFELITLRRAWAVGDDGKRLAFHKKAAKEGDNSQMSILRRIVRGPRPKLRDYRKDLSQTLESTLMKGMSIKPEDRYADVEVFAKAVKDSLLEDSLNSSEPEPLRAITPDLFDGLSQGLPGKQEPTERAPAPKTGRKLVWGDDEPTSKATKPSPPRRPILPAAAAATEAGPLPQGNRFGVEAAETAAAPLPKVRVAKYTRTPGSISEPMEDSEDLDALSKETTDEAQWTNEGLLLETSPITQRELSPVPQFPDKKETN